jgi:hypothetical protein
MRLRVRHKQYAEKRTDFKKYPSTARDEVSLLVLSERHTSALRVNNATLSLCVVPSCADPDYRLGSGERLAGDRDNSRDRILDVPPIN